MLLLGFRVSALGLGFRVLGVVVVVAVVAVVVVVVVGAAGLISWIFGVGFGA